MTKPILVVDFDGVVHSFTSGWKGIDVIPDPPVPGALRWLWKATEWFDVQVYSSRSSDQRGRDAMRDWVINHSLDEFGHDHPMCVVNQPHPIAFPVAKPPAFLTIDDRALCFEGDWSALDPAELLKFKPWHQR